VTERTRKLLYSERKALAETGTLGPLTDKPTPALVRAITHLAEEGSGFHIGLRFKREVDRVGRLYLGWAPAETLNIALFRAKGDAFLDLVEVIVEKGGLTSRHPGTGYTTAAIPQAGQQMNDLFERYRFGYKIEDGEIRKIGSPALDEVVVGPALMAVKRPGWQEAERSFKEAIQHQRGGPAENDDALTAANAALESAMKAAGFKGDRLSTLAKSFRNSDHVPSELKGVPEALDTLLKRSGAIRDSHSDSHGKAPGADPVPQELVDLAIHWAGAFIVFLSEAVDQRDR
jgi:hypothetical protein